VDDFFLAITVDDFSGREVYFEAKFRDLIFNWSEPSSFRMSHIAECEEWDWLLIAAENLAKKNSKKPISERDFQGIFGVDSFTTKYVYYIYLADHPTLCPSIFVVDFLVLKNYETDVNCPLKFM
jgi:hypothetical protein